MNKEEKLRFEFCKDIFTKTPILGDLIKKFVEEVEEYNGDEILHFLNDITVNESLVKITEPKTNYDVKCNLDIPNLGRIKIFVYVYFRQENDDLELMMLANRRKIQRELVQSNEDDGYHVLRIYPIWLTMKKEGDCS